MWYGVQNMSKYDIDIKEQPLGVHGLAIETGELDQTIESVVRDDVVTSDAPVEIKEETDQSWIQHDLLPGCSWPETWILV